MTDEQKKADLDFHVKKGTLITRRYTEAWAIAWAKLSKEEKQKFFDLPNFDWAIFTEITGIVSPDQKQESENEIVLNGVRYRRV